MAMGKRWIVLLLLLCLAAALASGVIADFGDFSGDSDYGGSSWSDSDSSWSGSGGDSGDAAFNFYVTLFWVAVIIIIMILENRKKKKNGSASDAKTAAKAALRPMQEYSSIDPAFQESALRERISNLYVQMQNCWTGKDITPLRPYFDDAYFTQMDRQLAQHRKQHKTNYVERIAVLSVEFKGFRQQAGKDHILATVKTRIVDYTLDDATGKLLSGSRKKEKFMTYEYDLCRATGYRTPRRRI